MCACVCTCVAGRVTDLNGGGVCVVFTLNTLHHVHGNVFVQLSHHKRVYDGTQHWYSRMAYIIAKNIDINNYYYSPNKHKTQPLMVTV